MPTEWVKKFELKTDTEVMLLQGGQTLKFVLDIELMKDIPEGSYLGVEVYGSGNLGRVMCMPILVSSALNAFISHSLFYSIISIK